MGRITAPFGVRGWLKLRPLTETTASLLAYRKWWVGRDADWQLHDVAEARLHAGDALVARLTGFESRDAASTLRGAEVAVPRSALPPAPPGQYYWADLLGSRVVNGQSQELGRVVRILQTGANDVLVVNGERERLIPFIGEVIAGMDAAEGVLRVNWGADY